MRPERIGRVDPVAAFLQMRDDVPRGETAGVQRRQAGAQL